jgi:hypothetical protein
LDWHWRGHRRQHAALAHRRDHVLILLCAIYESTTPRDAAFGPSLQNLLLVYFVLGITLTAIVRTFDSPNVEGSRKRPSLSLPGVIAVPVALIVLIA